MPAKWKEWFAASARTPARFDTVFPVLAAVVFLAVSLAVLLDYSFLGDMAVEADFLAEIAPAARHLAEGRLDVADYPFKGPVSAMALALLHLVTGPWGLGLFRTGNLLSLMAAAGVLFFVYRIGLGLWGRRTAMAALVLTACNKLFFINAHKAGSDLLFLALALAVVWLVLDGRKGARASFLIGLLAGLAFLTRYIGVVVPLWALAAVLLMRRHPQPWRERIDAAGWICLGFLAVAGPWVVLSLVQTGSLLVTNNLQNVVQGLYPQDSPTGGFASLTAVVTHDPFQFAMRYLTNTAHHFRMDLQQVVGLAMGVPMVLGLFGVFLPRNENKPRQLLVAFGLLYLLAYGLVFYLARFSLPLVPIYALLAASLLDRLPRWAPWVVLAVLGYSLFSQVDYARVAVRFYRAEQPLYLERSFTFLKMEASKWPGENPPRLMARKPHAAWYGHMDYVAYPGRLDGAAELLAYASESGADYLAAGLIEHRFFMNSEFLENLDTYAGVEKVFRADGNIIYRLDRRETGGGFGTRGETEQLLEAWRAAVARQDTARVMNLGSKLIEVLDADGRYEEARDVGVRKVGFAGDHDILVTRLNLAWVCLKLQDPNTGISALEGHLTRDGTRDRDIMVAKGRLFLGQLYHEAGDIPAARKHLQESLDLYIELGMEQDAQPLRDFLEQLEG